MSHPLRALLLALAALCLLAAAGCRRETPTPTTPAVTPTTPGALSGPEVFLNAASPTCASCHTIEGLSNADIGPNLTHIGTVAGTRVPGLSAEEYIRQSIEDPDAYVVEGFSPGIMPPDIRQTLTDEQYETLVQYLLSLR